MMFKLQKLLTPFVLSIEKEGPWLVKFKLRWDETVKTA
jgi:hypothetical protein